MSIMASKEDHGRKDSAGVLGSEIAEQAAGALIGRLRAHVLNLTAAAVVVAAIAAAYSNSLHGPFIFDDYDSILGNQTIRKLWPINQPLSPPAGFGSTVEGRPLLNLTFAVNYALGEYDVFGYHVFNLIVHALSAILLFGLVRRTLLLPRLAGSTGKHSTWLALVAALLWAVHPLGTQAVSYLSQRAESLAAFFCLLTLYVSARGMQSARPAGWYVAAILTCALGMGCKETMVSAPVVVLLYDRLLAGGSFRELFRRRWRLYAGLAASWGVLVYLMLQTPGRSGTAGFGCGVAAMDYTLTQFGVICHYLLLSVWPDPLIMDYGTTPARGLWQILPWCLLIAALLALTIWAIIRRPAIGFLGAAFFILLAPTSSFVPLKDLQFEYRMYLPLAALTVFVVCLAWAGWRRLLERHSGKTGPTMLLLKILPAILAFLAVCDMGILTWLRNSDYRRPDKLWEENVARRPANARAWANWGAALRNEYEQSERAGRPDRRLLLSAVEKCDRAVGLDKAEFHGWFNRGLAQKGLGQFRDAIDDFTRAIEIRPKYYLPYAQRAAACSLAGSDRLALADWDQIVDMDPDRPENYRIRGDLYVKAGKFNDALLDFNKAIELDARYAEAYNSRGTVYRLMNSPQLDMRDKALKDFQTAVELKPGWAEAWCNLAAVKADMRMFKNAFFDLSRAIELKPDYAMAYFQRGSVLGATGQTPQAIGDFDAAIRLYPGFIQAYANRARAHYEMQQYDKAWADVHKVEALGGRMDLTFVQELMRVSGGAK
ncbi:MAG: tetratricopeptide repeat protein [Planctomycetes bacterium]|nr:tetratricopeptide repeat protein [Planctomycetota bacterium]